MSNSVKYSIDGDTNAEQVSGRVKASLTGLDKQMEGIGKKFGNSFKDLFLSFLGPMALVGAAMGFIGKFISDNQKRHEDATQSAIDGTNKLMSTEDRYWANRRNNESTSFKNVQEANLVRIQTTEQFLREDPRGNKMIDDDVKNSPKGLFESNSPYAALKRMSLSKATQDKIQAILAEDMKANPIAMAGKDTSFSGPSGFSNIIGVGANPVLENMTRQTDIQQQILEHLKGSKPMLGITDVDFTKGNPSINYTT